MSIHEFLLLKENKNKSVAYLCVAWANYMITNYKQKTDLSKE